MKRASVFEFALAAVASVAVQALQVATLGLGTDRDAEIYRDYAHSWATGSAPYHAFAPEYPPGSMFLFLWAFLSGGADIDLYRQAFAWEMAAFASGGAILVLLHARRLWPASAWRRAAAVALYLAALAGVSPLVHRRFDLVPAILVSAALYAGPRIASLLLGVGAGVKLWPAAVLLPHIADAWRRRRFAAAGTRAAWFAAGVALMFLPFVPRAGRGVFGFLQYHLDRGFQVESSWAFLVFSLAALGFTQAHVEFEHGADHVVSDVVSALKPVSSLVTVALVLLPVALLLRRRDDDDRALRLQAATAIVAGFMLGSKVLSPQFVIWLAPLAAVAVLDQPKKWQRILGATCCAAAPLLTTLVFLKYYTDLCEYRAVAFAVAGARFASLAGIYGLATSRVAGFTWASIRILRPRRAPSKSAASCATERIAP